MSKKIYIILSIICFLIFIYLCFSYFTWSPMGIYKPVLYLYPTQDIEVNVTFKTARNVNYNLS
jgi:hypothetical protein